MYGKFKSILNGDINVFGPGGVFSIDKNGQMCDYVKTNAFKHASKENTLNRKEMLKLLKESNLSPKLIFLLE